MMLLSTPDPDKSLDGYAEGLIDKGEFEPRITGLRRRIAKLGADAAALRNAAEQAHSLQLVISKLSLFAEKVRERLEAADWSTRRDIICALVKRIEVTDDVVRVVFRVEPGSSGPPVPLRRVPYCPTRRRAAQDADHWRVLLADRPLGLGDRGVTMGG
jgi:site-specific DNA recombinase